MQAPNSKLILSQLHLLLMVLYKVNISSTIKKINYNQFARERIIPLVLEENLSKRKSKTVRFLGSQRRGIWLPLPSFLMLCSTVSDIVLFNL